MQKQTTSKQDHSVDEISESIKWNVKTVEVQKHLSLIVTFTDGTRGVVSMNPEWLTGVFTVLQDHEIFNAISVEYGAVTWPNGLDLDPKTMYDAIKAEGHYILV